MKKIFKKALAIFLAALMSLTVAPVIVFAAEEESTTVAGPVLALEIIEETASEVKVAMILKENTFKCLDLSVNASDTLTLTTISINPQFLLDGGCASSNIENGMISIATTTAPVAEYEIVVYSYTKASAFGVDAEDFSISLITCGITDDNTEVDVTEFTTVNNAVPSEHIHIADGDWHITTPATCAVEGEQVRYCGICGDVAETDIVAKTNEHNNTVTEEKEPTCTENGYTKIYCNDCETYISNETIEASGHGETKRETLAPTCTENGYIKDICTVCEEVAKETILGATGHGYIQDIKVATCTENGYIREFCPACGDVKPGAIELISTGHRWLDWEVVDEPTHSKEGVERRVCDSCGIDEERSIPRLVTAATELVMSMQEISMNFKQTTRLFVNVLPEEAAYSTEIIWESSNPEVATVDEEGSVYAAAPGTAVITAKTADGTLTAECEVTVKYSILQYIIIFVLFGWLWYM